MTNQGTALLFAAGIIGIALVFSKTTINNTNQVTTVNTQTATQSGGGGGGSPLAALASVFGF